MSLLSQFSSRAQSSSVLHTHIYSLRPLPHLLPPHPPPTPTSSSSSAWKKKNTCRDKNISFSPPLHSRTEKKRLSKYFIFQPTAPSHVAAATTAFFMLFYGLQWLSGCGEEGGERREGISFSLAEADSKKTNIAHSLKAFSDLSVLAPQQ